MTSLQEPVLGTPKNSWQFHPLHLTTSYLIKEFFSVHYYKKCIKMTQNSSGESVDFSDIVKGVLGQDLPRVKNVKELHKWTVDAEADDYHEMHTHGFIGMYSVFESGLENIVSEIIRNDKDAAKKITKVLKNKNIDMSDWPWSQDRCIWVASRLENYAIRQTKGQGVFSRIRKLFELIEVDLKIEEKDRCVLSDIHEAKEIRNIILHRYGVVSESDAQKVKALKPWVGKTVVMDYERYKRYFNAMKCILMGLMRGIESSRYAKK